MLMKKQDLWFVCMHGWGASEFGKAIFEEYASAQIKKMYNIHIAGYTTKDALAIEKNALIIIPMLWVQTVKIRSGKDSKGNPTPQVAQELKEFVKTHKNILFLERPLVNLNRTESTPQEKQLAEKWIATITKWVTRKSQTKQLRPVLSRKKLHPQTPLRSRNIKFNRRRR